MLKQLNISIGNSAHYFVILAFYYTGFTGVNLERPPPGEKHCLHWHGEKMVPTSIITAANIIQSLFSGAASRFVWSMQKETRSKSIQGLFKKEGFPPDRTRCFTRWLWHDLTSGFCVRTHLMACWRQLLDIWLNWTCVQLNLTVFSTTTWSLIQLQHDWQT